MTRRLATAQGWYFLASGVWPLLSRRTFEAVTGPKTDFWLAQTVGAVVGSIGVGLLTAARRERITPELAFTAGAAAGALTAVDIVFVSRGRISPVYLIDALIECTFATSWLRSATTDVEIAPRPVGDRLMRNPCGMATA